MPKHISEAVQSNPLVILVEIELLRQPESEEVVAVVCRHRIAVEACLLRKPNQADRATAGAGELARSAEGLGVPASTPLLLLSLATALPSCAGFASLEPLVSLFTSPLKSVPDFFGARHAGTSQVTPVKLLSWKPLRSHFLHGLPDRSSARRPALMAPWFALGPNL